MAAFPQQQAEGSQVGAHPRGTYSDLLIHDSALRGRPEGVESSFLVEREARFRETAALTRLLESERRAAVEQSEVLRRERDEWKKKAVVRYRKLQAVQADKSLAVSEAESHIEAVRALEDRVEALRESERASMDQLSRIRQSASWRLTKPLRYMSSFFLRFVSPSR